MKKTYTVYCNDGKSYTFIAETAYIAIKKMIYYLNLSHKCESVINKTEHHECYLYIEDDEKIYYVKND